MSGKPNQERKEYWIKKIDEWKSSGKTGFSWCKDNNICEKSFYRWRSFFSNKKIKLKKSSFIELSNIKSHVQLEIEYKKYKFKLREFNHTELQEFLKLLKAL